MAVRNDPSQLTPLYVIAVVIFGGLGYWWVQLDETQRLVVLATVAKAEGTAVTDRIPRDDMPMQVWWMVRHRGAQLGGMAKLLVLCVVIGMVEGGRKRETVQLAGFGLGLFTMGRVVLAAAFLGLFLYLVVPLVMPFVWICCLLSGCLGGASYALMRGMPRVS